MAALQRGEAVAARDPKMVYGGAHGLPIREQIVARSDHEIVTRNGYGARCLNVPDVLFADLDDARQPLEGCAVSLLLIATLVSSSIIGALGGGNILWYVATGALVALASQAAHKRLRYGLKIRDRMLHRVREYATARPGRRMAIYQTPAGLLPRARQRQAVAHRHS